MSLNSFLFKLQGTLESCISARKLQMGSEAKASEFEQYPWLCKNTFIFIANPMEKWAALSQFFPNKICLKHKTFFVGEGLLLLLRILLHFK